MSALAAVIARPQLALLSSRAETWNTRYNHAADALCQVAGVRVPERDAR
ncbi:MAG: hypothetical protein P8I99_05650 [Acidimicrobiales bacterium]|nr:hypothetical protein [Acidimicrobiales bacterium]